MLSVKCKIGLAPLFKDYLCKSVKSVGDSYPKNKYAIAIAAMTPAKSASKPQATA